MRLQAVSELPAPAFFAAWIFLGACAAPPRVSPVQPDSVAPKCAAVSQADFQLIYVVHGDAG